MAPSGKKRTRRHLRGARLTSLAFLITAAAIVTLVLAERQKSATRRTLTQRITAIGGNVIYEHQFGDEDEYNPVRSAEPYPDPGWMQALLLGEDSALRIQTVQFPNGLPVDGQVLKMLRDLDEVRHVVLNGSLADDDTLSELAGLENVEILSLTATNVTDKGLASVGRMSNLRQLGANFLPITAEGLQHLGILPQLEWVEAYETSLTEEGVAQFQQLRPDVRMDRSRARDEAHRSGLVQLMQSGFTVERRERDDEQGIAYRIGTPFPIAFGPWRVNWHGSEEDLEVLPDISDVQILHLSHNVSVEGTFTDKVLEPVSRLASLQELTLSETSITNEGLHKITNLRQLKSLDLSRTSIGDDASRHVAQLKALEELRLYRTNVGDEGVRHLQLLPLLRRLDLSHTRITPEAIDALARIETLSELDVDGNEFSEEAYERLRGLLPNSRIKWKGRWWKGTPGHELPGIAFDSRTSPRHNSLADESPSPAGQAGRGRKRLPRGGTV